MFGFVKAKLEAHYPMADVPIRCLSGRNNNALGCKQILEYLIDPNEEFKIFHRGH